MCSGACIRFVEENLNEIDIQGKDVIEIGSRFVNGTARWAIEQHNPKSYIGIDMFEGPNVDKVCSIEDTFNQFEPESFDIVLSTELLEHIIDFRLAINAMKRLCRKNGIIVITTRSKGFGLHGYPYDFWRYEKEDMDKLFSDFQINKCIKDPSHSPGVFLIAKKNNDNFIDITDFELYNILFDRIMKCNVDLLEKKISQQFPTKHEENKNYFETNKVLYDYGARRNTDKTLHGYLDKYEFFLKKFRDENFTFIELGVGKGSSLMMWHDYFRKAKIIGVDKNKKCLKLQKERISIEILDLGNINSYKILLKYSPLIILDDASHLWEHQLLSFFELFKILPSGGIYIMENIQTSFEPYKEQYRNNISISPYEVLYKISEAVVSDNSPDRNLPDYSIYINALSKSIDMISFIKGSCIIIKK